MAIIKATFVGFGFLVMSLSLTSGLAAGPQPGSAYKPVDTLLKAKCVSCHSAKGHAGGLDLSSYKATMAGTTKGKVVMAGKPDTSDLVLYLQGTKKPLMPMGGKKLSAADINLVRTWIKGGAKP